VDGNIGDRRSYTLSGEVTLDEGRLAIEGLKAPLRDAFLTIRFDRDRVHVPRLAFHVGDSDVRVSGVVDDWMETPKARFLVESSQIDGALFESLVGRGSKVSGNVPTAAGWWTDGSIEATFFVDYLYYRKFLVTGFSCRIAWDHGVLTVDRLSGDTNEGHVGGRLVVQQDGPQSAQVRSAFRVSGVPIERLLMLASDRPIMQGWLTTTGRVQAHFTRMASLTHTLVSRRPVQITIEDGKIHHVPVITKLLAIMNLPALLEGQVDLAKRGLPFDRLKLVLSADRGTVGIKQFLLDSPVLKLSGTGKYDLLADQFDMTIAASPLGSYSRLVKSVPLFGTLLAGDRQGFDTAIFSVTGKAGDPDIRYLPAESLVTGLKGTAQLAFDILVNAITLPKEAFELTEEALGEVDGEGARGTARSSLE
jgi:hypothetical protein